MRWRFWRWLAECVDDEAEIAKRFWVIAVGDEEQVAAVAQGYATADAKNLDTDCLAEVRAPPFAIELSELGAQR